MINYQYQILRYTHDRVSGEFVNVGLLLYSEEEGFLDCRVVTKYSRISNFFGEINGTFLLSTLKHFENRIKEIAQDLGSFANSNKLMDLSSFSSYLLPKDDSALTITEIYHGLDINAQKGFEDLYERLINLYVPENDSEVQTDEKAWRKVYKKYFDSVGVTDKLKKHDVKTKKDSIQFNQAWKNGVWNCYQPLSFDLKAADSIKSKVYKWSGILQELETSAEPLKVYLLTTNPTRHLELEEFILSTLRSHSKKHLEVSVVTEDHAEDFAMKVRIDMEKSKKI